MGWIIALLVVILGLVLFGLYALQEITDHLSRQINALAELVKVQGNAAATDRQEAATARTKIAQIHKSFLGPRDTF